MIEQTRQELVLETEQDVNALIIKLQKLLHYKTEQRVDSSIMGTFHCNLHVLIAKTNRIFAGNGKKPLGL